ncbi:autotransporter domain-containing protein [Bradyrhizobium sp. B117]|uniref:autotransporter outer membrane beta-barrel domain-containing protein n=1 Tax=Bradyrhizobium sp. B117 TaxID=3140246 RepID=UPI0031845EA8
MSGKRKDRLAATRHLRAALLTSSALALAWALPAAPSRADDATWLPSPPSNDYSAGANWSTHSVPTGTAYFDVSNTTNLLNTSDQTIGGWTFNLGASDYTFTNSNAIFGFNGAGIVVNGGSIAITNNYNQLNFYNSSTAGSASITNAGVPGFNGVLGFNDHSTAGNATITNNGSITFQNFSTAGSATITNNSSAQLNFYNASTAGTATITNHNIINFRDTSAAGNAAISNDHGLMFFDASTAGSATFTNNAGGEIIFMNTSAAGSSVITNNGYGVSFLDTTTAGNATIINNSILQFADSSTAGNAAITNNGVLGFFINGTGGNASILNNAGGKVDVSHSTGPADDGKLSIGSIAGAGAVYLGARQLTVGGNNLSTTVSGVISDCGASGTACYASLFGLSATGGSLVKVGTGTLTLSGVNTYTGATTIDGGTLAVNGSIASSSSLTVNSGGTLGGTGIVGNTTIASGGTLAPGNSVGTLTVSGNLAFGAGSFYRVEVSTTAADRTNVTGTATLTGATVQAVALPGSFRSQTYTILNATGGLGGTKFAGLSVSGSFSPTRNPHLTYDVNNVYLVLDPGTIVLPASTGANQISVAGGINKAVEGGATPPSGFDALLNMSGAPLNHGLSQVSGQPGAAGTQASFSATQQFVNMLDPLGGGTDGERGGTAGDSGTLGYASTAPNDARVREAYAAVTPRDASAEIIDRRWGVWASGYGGASTLNGNAASGSSTTTSHIYGTVVGADYRVSPNTLVGFALGGAGYNFALSDSLGGGRADLFQAGFYGRHNFGPAYLSAALAYGWQDVTTDRTVTVSGTDKLTANFKASTFSGRLEAGWRFAPIPASSFGVAPYAAVQATTFHLPGYGETAIVGSNQFALSYTAQDTTNVRTELGARTDQRFLVNDGVLTLRGRLAWAHDTNTSRLVNAAFQTLPGAAFTVNGAQPAADSALVGGRAEMKWRNGLSLAGTIEGEFSQSTQTYTGKGTVRYEW